MAEKAKMKKDVKQGWASEVTGAIYNMYEDQAAKGNLGTYAKQTMEKQKKRGKRFFDE